MRPDGLVDHAPAINQSPEHGPPAAEAAAAARRRRNQLVVVIAVATSSLGFDFSTPFLPLYVHELTRQDLSTTALWSGLVIGAGPLTAALVAPLWGIVADRYGRKLIVIVSLAGFALLQLSFIFATSVIHLVLIRIAMGSFGGLPNTAMALAIADTPPERIGPIIGRVQAAQFVPLAIGPIIGGVLADRFGLRSNFVLAASLSVLALLVILVLYRGVSTLAQRPDELQPATASSTPSLWRFLRTPVVLVVVLVLFVGQFVDRSFTPILPIYIVELDTPVSLLASAAGMIISAGALATAISANLMGRLSARCEIRFLVVFALLSGATLTVLISLVDSVWQLLIFRMLLGLFAGGMLTLAYTLGSRQAPWQHLATTLSIFGSSTMLGGGVSFLLSGLIGYLNLRGVFLMDALLYLGCLALVALNWRKLAELAFNSKARLAS